MFAFAQKEESKMLAARSKFGTLINFGAVIGLVLLMAALAVAQSTSPLSTSPLRRRIKLK
jgi:hypothetical protein